MKRDGGSKRPPIALGAALAVTFLRVSSANSAPANSLRELYAAVSNCIQTPTSAMGTEITVVFSIKRDGSLLGTPRIAYARFLGDTNTRKRFVADFRTAFSKCFPLSISKGFGNVVAGQPLFFRVIASNRRVCCVDRSAAPTCRMRLAAEKTGSSPRPVSTPPKNIGITREEDGKEFSLPQLAIRRNTGNCADAVRVSMRPN